MKIEIKHGVYNPSFLFLACPHCNFFFFVLLCLTFFFLILRDVNYRTWKTMVILAAKLPLALSAPLMLQRPYEYQTLTTNISFDTLLGLNYEILWMKLF
jgi:hypothetical protein